MPSEIQIREARPEDAAAIATVLYESFVEYEALYTPEGFAATTPTAKQIVARMNEGPVWVALRKDELLGSVAAVAKGESLYMRGMAVLPTARGLGIGIQLLAQVECLAAERGYTRVFLSTTPFLHAAIRRTDAGPHDLFGTPLFTMEKRILPQK